MTVKSDSVALGYGGPANKREIHQRPEVDPKFWSALWISRSGRPAAPKGRVMCTHATARRPQADTGRPPPTLLGPCRVVGLRARQSVRHIKTPSLAHGGPPPPRKISRRRPLLRRPPPRPPPPTTASTGMPGAAPWLQLVLFTTVCACSEQFMFALSCTSRGLKGVVKEGRAPRHARARPDWPPPHRRCLASPAALSLTIPTLFPLHLHGI
jgi:hypothetical protein